MLRIGTGYDIHKLVSGRPLIIGGISVPFEKGLLGHSDGDVLLHAIADAIFGACAEGDIGRQFPDKDPAYKNADSFVLLKKVVELVSAKGFKLINIDTNIIAELPRFAPHISKMRERISKALDLDISCVSVKARTNEGVDAVGRQEAIAAQVVVLVEKKDEK